MHRSSRATSRSVARALGVGWRSVRATFFAVVLVAAPAHAYHTEVDASVAAQFYSLESPYGEPLLRMRRFTNTLGMALYDLDGDASGRGPTLTFRSRLRLDADLGQDPAERDPSSTRYVPGLEQAPLDLMYAYLEGDRYLNGSLGFRLGRQYVIDMLGFWSFDGAEVTLAAPGYLRLEAYGGFEQRSGMPLLTTPRFQADGVARGSRDDLRNDQWTSYLEQSRVAPALGVALETADVNFLHARVTYRRVTNSDTVVVSPFADENGNLRTTSGSRVSSEKVGASLRIVPFPAAALAGSVVYDLYARVFANQALALDVFPARWAVLGLDYERIVPTFDADSIFNWFAHSAMTSFTARADGRFSRRLDAGVTGGTRLYQTLGDPATYASDPNQETIRRELDPFATLAGRYRYNDGSVSVRGQAEVGDRGHRVGGDVTSRKTFDAGYYDSLVVLSLYDFKDELRPDRYATSFSYVLGVGILPNALGTRSRLGLEWEQSMNRLVGQRYRILATLDISVFR